MGGSKPGVKRGPYKKRAEGLKTEGEKPSPPDEKVAPGSPPAAPTETLSLETPPEGAPPAESPSETLSADTSAGVSESVPANLKDATAELLQLVSSAAPRVEPEGAAAAKEARKLREEKKKRGPYKKVKELTEEEKAALEESIQVAAKRWTEQVFMISSILNRDPNFLPQAPKARAFKDEETIQEDFARWFRKVGIKESDPKFDIALDIAIMHAHRYMGIPSSRKKFFKRTQGLKEKFQLGLQWLKVKVGGFFHGGPK